MVQNVEAWGYIAFDWPLVAITFIAVVIRLYVRIFLQVHMRNAWWWMFSEIFVVLGWLLFLGVAICDSLIVHTGGENMTPGFKMTTEQHITFLKVEFAWSWLFKPSIYMMKTIGDNTCANSVAYPVVTWVFHVLTDLLVFALPFMLLRTTLRAGKHSVGEWSGALIMFGLGAINVLAAIVCMVLRLLPENYYDTPRTDKGVVVIFLYTVQIATGIAIPCCPQIRIFIKHISGQYSQERDRLRELEYTANMSRRRSTARSGKQAGPPTGGSITQLITKTVVVDVDSKEMPPGTGGSCSKEEV